MNIFFVCITFNLALFLLLVLVNNQGGLSFQVLSGMTLVRMRKTLLRKPSWYVSFFVIFPPSWSFAYFRVASRHFTPSFLHFFPFSAFIFLLPSVSPHHFSSFLFFTFFLFHCLPPFPSFTPFLPSFFLSSFLPFFVHFLLLFAFQKRRLRLDTKSNCQHDNEHLKTKTVILKMTRHAVNIISFRLRLTPLL